MEEEELQKDEDIEAYKQTSGVGVWHDFEKLPFRNGFQNIQIMGMMTGCGLAQMVNVIIFNHGKNKDVTKNQLKGYLNDQKNDGVGAVLCVLGQNSYGHQPRLEELGFKQIAEYSNYRHGQHGNYKQRLFILTL